MVTSVLFASKFVPVVIWELDDLSLPELILVGMNLLPKVAAPLKVLLVDV